VSRFYQKVGIELLLQSSKSKFGIFWWGLGTKPTLFPNRKEKSLFAPSSVYKSEPLGFNLKAAYITSHRRPWSPVSISLTAGEPAALVVSRFIKIGWDAYATVSLNQFCNVEWSCLEEHLSSTIIKKDFKSALNRIAKPQFTENQEQPLWHPLVPLIKLPLLE